jgi:hypothetical protein
MEHWKTLIPCYGMHWHTEDTFGAVGPTDEWYWNGETRIWPVQALSIVNQTPQAGAPYIDEFFVSPNWTITTTGDWNVDDTFGWGILRMGNWGPADGDAWVNQSNLTLPDSPIVEIVFRATLLYDDLLPAPPVYIEVLNDTTRKVIPYILPSDNAPGWPGPDHKIDISEFAGQDDITISYHINISRARMTQVLIQLSGSSGIGISVGLIR